MKINNSFWTILLLTVLRRRSTSILRLYFTLSLHLTDSEQLIKCVHLIDTFQSKMPLRFETFFQFACMTILLSITHTPAIANNQFETPLLYVHNMFTKNVAIEEHTIHSVNVSSPWECFRHCAKHCDCVTFQVTGNTCELLDTDQNGAAEKLVNRPGTLVFSMQQSISKVSPCSHTNSNK